MALAVPVWWVMWVITGSAADGLLAVTLLLAVMVFVLWPTSTTVGLLLAVAVAAGIAGWRVHHLSVSPVAALAQQRVSAQLTLTVTSLPREHPGQTTFRADLQSVSTEDSRWEGSVPVTVRLSTRHPDLRAGSVLHTAGTLMPGRDHQPAVARIRIDQVVDPVVPADLHHRLVHRVWAGLHQACARLPPTSRALVPALVTGDTNGFTPQLDHDLRRTGLLHLAAVSGANLAILVSCGVVTARWLGVRGVLLRVIAGLAILVFIAISGSEPSVFRAAAMGTVTLVAATTVGAARPVDPARGLQYLAGACLVLLMVDPWLSHSFGFALSVAASAGIISCSRAWAARMSWCPGAELITVPLAAQVATQPLITTLSGEISLVGLWANMAAAILVAPATVLGFAAALASLIHPPTAALLATGAGWAAHGITTIAQEAAMFPLASIRWETTPGAIAIVTVGSAAALILLPFVLRRWWLTVMAAGVWLFLLATAGPHTAALA